MIFGDTNEHLGTAELFVALLAGLIVFLVGLGVIAALSARLLGLARFGVVIFVVLAAVGAVITLGFGPFFLATDGPVYDGQAASFASHLRDETSRSSLTDGKEGWPVLLGVVYFLVGRVPFVGILISCIAVGVSAVFGAGTARLLWGGFSPRALYAWYFATPLIVFLGPSLMREALCWMAISMIVFGFVAATRGTIHAIWVFVIGASVLIAVRTSLAVLILLAIGVSWLVCSLIAKRKFFMVVLIGVVAAAFASTFLRTILAQLGFSEQSLESNRVYIAVDATTGFSPSALQPGVGGFFLTAAQAFPKVLLGPFPWEIGLAPAWIWVVANSIVWLVMLTMAIRRCILARDRRWVAVLVVATGLLVFGMSLSLTNYGIIVRMRGAGLMLLLPLVLGGFYRGNRTMPAQEAATSTEPIEKPQTAPPSPAKARPISGPSTITTVSTYRPNRTRENATFDRAAT